MSEPQRIQRKRTKGYRMPDNTMSVARPGKWGNPFRVGDPGVPDNQAAVDQYRAWLAQQAVDLSPLRGKNLACYCRLDQPCHADVLLELANATSKELLR